MFTNRRLAPAYSRNVSVERSLWHKIVLARSFVMKSFIFIRSVWIGHLSMYTVGMIVKSFWWSVPTRPRLNFLSIVEVHKNVSWHFITAVKNNFIAILMMFKHAYRPWSAAVLLLLLIRNCLSGPECRISPFTSDLEYCIVHECRSRSDRSDWPLILGSDLVSMSLLRRESLSRHEPAMLHECRRCLVERAESVIAFVTSAGKENFFASWKLCFCWFKKKWDLINFCSCSVCGSALLFAGLYIFFVDFHKEMHITAQFSLSSSSNGSSVKTFYFVGPVRFITKTSQSFNVPDIVSGSIIRFSVTFVACVATLPEPWKFPLSLLCACRRSERHFPLSERFKERSESTSFLRCLFFV